METKGNGGNKLAMLINKDLSRFKVVRMTEVYRTDTNGKKVASIGFFRDHTIALVFAGQQQNRSYCATNDELVLTDGNIGYVLYQTDPVKLFNDELEAPQLKLTAMAKLDPMERKLLGLSEE